MNQAPPINGGVVRRECPSFKERPGALRSRVRKRHSDDAAVTETMGKWRLKKVH